MDFSDTSEEAVFRTEASAWLDANAKRLLPGRRKASAAEQSAQPGGLETAKTWQARKADAGWACITWPAEYGGRAASAIQNVIWEQEEGRFDTPPNVFTIGQGMLGPTLMVHGSDAQKSRHLPPMLRGEEIWCQLFSEPGAGSDLAGLRTSAQRDADDWLISGQKIWTSGAHYSKWGMILTRTDPHAAKHAGITYFIVDMESPAIEIRPILQMNGRSGFNEVFFDRVRVPDANRVGAVDDGWRCAITTLMNERASLGGGGVGPDFDDLWKLARDAAWGGGHALDDHALRQQLADFYVRLQGLRTTRDRTLTALSRGETPGPESSAGKLVGARLRQRMASFALDLGGASGAMLEGSLASWQQSFLDTPGARLAGGSDEILRNIIAERVLRLPAESRADKDVAFSEIPTGPPTS